MRLQVSWVGLDGRFAGLVQVGALAAWLPGWGRTFVVVIYLWS